MGFIPREEFDVVLEEEAARREWGQREMRQAIGRLRRFLLRHELQQCRQNSSRHSSQIHRHPSVKNSSKTFRNCAFMHLPLQASYRIADRHVIESLLNPSIEFELC